MSDADGPKVSVVLWQLQQYQMVIRKWQPHLTANEFAIVMQILDRTVGWQRLEATFRSSKLLDGDRMYGGLGFAMVRSTMMKAMRVLEDRGVLVRQRDQDRPWLKNYSLNLDWVPDTIWGVEAFGVTAVDPEAVSSEDRLVRTSDAAVSHGANGVSVGDPVEEYQDNTIGEHHPDETSRAGLPPAATDPRPLGEQDEPEEEVEEEGKRKADLPLPTLAGAGRQVTINPMARRRPGTAT